MKNKKHVLSLVSALMVSNFAFANTNAVITPMETSGIIMEMGKQTAKAGKISTEISSASLAISKTVIKNGQDMAMLIQNSSQQMMDAMYNISNQEMKDNTEVFKTLQEARLEYQRELTEAQVRSSQSKLMIDDTKEEFELMRDVLSANEEKDVRQVINYLKAEEKNNGVYVGITPKAVEDDPERKAACEKDGVDCTYKKPVTPSVKMEQLFAECSKIKREKKYTVAEKAKRIDRERKTSSSQIASMSTTNSRGAIAKRVEEQNIISCTPFDLKNGLCGELTQEEFIGAIKENALVPAGNISSNNLMSPTSFSAIGLMDEDKEEADPSTEKGKLFLEGMEKESLDRSEPLDENAPEIVDTYRNSNQLLAAIDFKNNVVNKDLISNQNVADRKKSSSYAFQSEFLARNARLSLAEKSFDEVIIERTGGKLSGFDKDSPYEDNPEKEYNPLEPVKESHNGAAQIDLIRKKVNEDFDNLVKVVSGEMSLGEIAPANIQRWKYESTTLQNKIIQKQNEKLERIELLMAAILSGEVNSAENIRLIESLRGGN